MRSALLALLLLVPVPAASQTAEKQVIVTITAADLKGGVVSEIAWDKGTLILQGVFANADGSLSAQYFVSPAPNVALQQRKEHTDGSLKYWAAKARTMSPTGIGQIS